MPSTRSRAARPRSHRRLQEDLPAFRQGCGEPRARTVDGKSQVLRLAAKGMGNRQIAAELAISDRTMQGHLANIYDKLQVSTRAEAVLFAVCEKWTNLE